MYSTIFSVSIIIISCSPIDSQFMGDSSTQIGNNGKWCTFSTLGLSLALRMPIIFSDNLQNPAILYPDENGNLSFKSGTSFWLSCVSGKFNVFEVQNIREIRVMCNDNQLLQYRRGEYKYTDFLCSEKQKSVIKKTEIQCQRDKSEDNVVVKVGFQTNYHFFVLYSVCFDMTSKNSLYTWFNARIPYFNNNEYHRYLPAEFKSHQDLYGKIGVNNSYKLETQKITVNRILKLVSSSETFVSSKLQACRHWARGHYAAKMDFFYAFEQEATFFYANAAPQWQNFNYGKWMTVENQIKSELAKNNRNRRVVITGSYGLCTLPDRYGLQTPLYLVMPAKHIAVPLFYWKMLYDADNGRNNIVFIGLNNPYANIQYVYRLMPCDRMPCPRISDDFRFSEIREIRSSNDNEGLVFCCTKDSFERVYGKLDPIVFDVNRT